MDLNLYPPAVCAVVDGEPVEAVAAAPVTFASCAGGELEEEAVGCHSVCYSWAAKKNIIKFA